MLDLFVFMCLARRIAQDKFPVPGVLVLWIVLVSVPFITLYLAMVLIAACADQIEKGARRVGKAARQWIDTAFGRN